MAEEANLGGAIPDDLITEILLNLPVKSLLRFRCVCKLWNYQIRSPDFIEKHLKTHSTKKDCILIARRPADLSETRVTTPLSLQSYDSLSPISPEIQVPFDDDIFNITVSGPCDGLVCISINLSDLMVCNPAMREFQLIPFRPFHTPGEYDWFDVAIGFGFDRCTESYKVVRIVKLDLQSYKDVYTAEVFDLSSRSWAQAEAGFWRWPMNLDGSGVFCNGAVHWVNSSINCNKDDIVRFNISNEELQRMDLPEDPERRKQFYLTVSDESLAVFAFTGRFDPSEQFIEMWKMEKYGAEESWKKLFNIVPISRFQAPLFLWNNEETVLLTKIELPQDMDSPPLKLYSCAIDTLEMKDLGFTRRRGLSFVAMVYHESLISIK